MKTSLSFIFSMNIVEFHKILQMNVSLILTVLSDFTNPLSAVITRETEPVTQKQSWGSEWKGGKMIINWLMQPTTKYRHNEPYVSCTKSQNLMSNCNGTNNGDCHDPWWLDNETESSLLFYELQELHANDTLWDIGLKTTHLFNKFSDLHFQSQDFTFDRSLMKSTWILAHAVQPFKCVEFSINIYKICEAMVISIHSEFILGRTE